MQILTRANQSKYKVPGKVLGVTYSQQGFALDIPLFFVAQSIPIWHVTSMNGQPKSVDESIEMLKSVYDRFTQPCWMTFEDTLIIWPPAINDGDVLSVEYDHKS